MTVFYKRKNLKFTILRMAGSDFFVLWKTSRAFFRLSFSILLEGEIASRKDGG